MYFRIISLYLGCVFEFSLSNPTFSLRLVINCYNSNVSWCLRQNVLFIFSEVPLSTNRPSSTPLSAALYCFSTKNNEDPIKKKKYGPCNESQVWGVKIKLNDLSPRHLLMILMAAGVVAGDIWQPVNHTTITGERGQLGGQRPLVPHPFFFVPCSTTSF